MASDNVVFPESTWARIPTTNFFISVFTLFLSIIYHIEHIADGYFSIHPTFHTGQTSFFLFFLCFITANFAAYISEDYISEDRIRLELYRRLSKAVSKETLYEIEEEMEDRFGKLDIPTKQFLELILIKILAIAKGINQISSYEMNITFVKSDGVKETIKSRSKDDDDIISATLEYLRK
jgi:hypothetical protein